MIEAHAHPPRPSNAMHVAVRYYSPSRRGDADADGGGWRLAEKNWVQAACTDASVQAHSDGSHVSQQIHHTVIRGVAPPMAHAWCDFSGYLKIGN